MRCTFFSVTKRWAERAGSAKEARLHQQRWREGSALGGQGSVCASSLHRPGLTGPLASAAPEKAVTF